MSLFYRWISCPENASIVKSNHGLTQVNVSLEDAEELRSIGRIAGDEFPIEPSALIIPLEVFEGITSFDGGYDSGGNYVLPVQLEVIPELDGVCCFNSETREIDEVLAYGSAGENFMMIFEGQLVGSVWDGDLAVVEKVIEIVPCDDFCARFDEVKA